MIRFEKVSFEEFKKEFKSAFKIDDDFGDDGIKSIYDDIKLPQRATEGSAGYDFFAPFTLHIFDYCYRIFPTGIRFVTDQKNVALLIIPRSGLGFKYQERLSNTVGLIDSDYQFAPNEGHIMCKIKGGQEFTVKKGDAYCQGILINYLTTDDDAEYAKEIRQGGFGSTTKEH